MSFSMREWEYSAPLLFRPRFAKTRNQSLFQAQISTVYFLRILPRLIVERKGDIPIRIRHLKPINLPQPIPNILLLTLTKRIPENMRRNSQRKAQWTHLHHPLIRVFQITPVFRVIGITPIDDSFAPAVGFWVLVVFSCEERCQTP